MNQWTDLANAIAHELDEFPEGCASEKGGASSQEIVARELYKSEDIDAAVHSFSTSGRWPLLSDNENFFIRQRLNFGLVLARALAATDPMHPEVEGPMFPNPGGDFTMDVQLQWLLIAAWKAAGRAAWAAQLR